MPRAARSACSAAFMSARPTRSRNRHNIATGTRRLFHLTEWVSVPVRATTFDRETGNPAYWKTAPVFGQMNELPGARMRVAETGPYHGREARDVGASECASFIDNIFRSCRLGSVRNPPFWTPFAVGYQLPPWPPRQVSLVSRTPPRTPRYLGTGRGGSLVDDLTDPALQLNFAHLDAPRR